MIRLRNQLVVATTCVWILWLLASILGWNGWSTYPASFPSLHFLLAAASQLSLWIGLVLASGALFAHILIVRDNVLYQPADGCECEEGCCSPDQSRNSS